MTTTGGQLLSSAHNRRVQRAQNTEKPGVEAEGDAGLLLRRFV
jgi:hypothetical protein